MNRISPSKILFLLPLFLWSYCTIWSAVRFYFWFQNQNKPLNNKLVSIYNCQLILIFSSLIMWCLVSLNYLIIMWGLVSLYYLIIMWGLVSLYYLIIMWCLVSLYYLIIMWCLVSLYYLILLFFNCCSIVYITFLLSCPLIQGKKFPNLTLCKIWATCFFFCRISFI